jgi:hypothetical protein
MNIGWTIGEEILFKAGGSGKKSQPRVEICKATQESCVLGIEKKNLSIIKKAL